jgi:RHS repeat-associated protein
MARLRQAVAWILIHTVMLTGMPLVAAAEAPAAPHVVLTTTAAIKSTGSTFPVSAKATDGAGQPLADAALRFRITSGPNSGFTRDVTTDDAGNASLLATSAAAGTDLIEAVYTDADGVETRSNQVALQWTGVQACPIPPDPPAAPASTDLVYLGPLTAEYGDTLSLAARAADSAGNAIPDHTVTFALGSQSKSAVTDANGIARAELAPSAVGSTTLRLDLAGDSAVASAHAEETVTVGRDETLLLFTGPTALAAGVPQSISATLLDGIDHAPKPLAGKTITFTVAGKSTSAVTGADGIAHATLIVPNATLGNTTLTASFAGDEHYLPSIRRIPAILYTASGFLVWGGNAGGLAVGQRVNFWGYSWASQVTGGAYDSTASFKGWSGSSALALCQPEATLATLTPGCWSVKDGQSGPPATLPAYIGVGVATAIAKPGSDIYGNIASVAVVKVDADPPYGNDPGKPGFGTIVAVATPSGVFSEPSLRAVIDQPASVLPGEAYDVAVNVKNEGNGVAHGIAVSAAFDGATPATDNATIAALSAPGNGSAHFRESTTAPATRGPNESSAAYETRLASLDGRLLTSVATVDYGDVAGFAHPPVVATGASTLRLPRLLAGITGRPCLSPGQTQIYSITITNIGTAAATKAAVQFRFPDDTTTTAAVGDLAAGASRTILETWIVPQLAAKTADEDDAAYAARLASVDGATLAATATETWSDARDNAYGDVTATHRATERVPNLALTTAAPAAVLPGTTAELTTTVKNQGTGNAIQTDLAVTQPDGTVARVAPFTLEAGKTSDKATMWSLPALAPKGTAESDAAYRARLAAADNLTLSFRTSLVWTDAGDSRYGEQTGSAETTQILPNLRLDLTGPTAALSGQTLTYHALIANEGHADAASVDLTVSLPDGTRRTLPVPSAARVPGGSADVAFTYDVPAPQPNGIATATATLSWTDATAGAYGPLAASVSTTITQPNQAPVVNAGPDLSILLNATATLAGSATDDGLPSPPSLTVSWMKVSGPGNVTFTAPSAALTSATFDTPGDYTLRLTASDGALSASDEVVVHVILVTLTLAPSVAGPNVVGTTQTLTATLRDGAGAPLAGADIVFSVSGANARSATVATNASGVAAFTYTGTANGSDTVQATTGTGPLLVTSNTARVDWITPVQKVSTSTILGRFFTAPNNGAFTATPAQQPVFNMNFPTINFNPPANTVPGNTSGVNEFTRPMYDVTTDLNGNFTGTILAHGNGAALGLGFMTNFNAVFTGTFTIAAAGPVTFNFYSDDGFIFGIGNGATRVSGALFNPPADLRTPFERFPVMGSFNTATAPVANSVTVNFPAPGAYPYELDYSECCQGQLAITMTTSTPNGNRGVPPTGSLVLAPNSFANQPVGSTQTLNVTATDASGLALAALPVSLIVTGANARELTGTTDAAGKVSFSYTGTNSGGDILQATAAIGSTTAYSNVVGIDRGTNHAPTANAGPDQTITLPANIVTLTGTATDDGSPTNGTLTYTWQQISGPTVPMSNPNGLANTITFATAGSYVFRLVINDGQLTATDDVTVLVNPDPNANRAPVVNAGPDQSITLPATATLTGTVTDDGKPAGAVVTVNWAKVSGPGTVTLTPANAAVTTAAFSVAGTYTLRLTASDTQLSASDDVVVLVGAANVAPTVNAGPDKTISLPTTSVVLSGTVTDDGKPAGNVVTVAWSLVSGPAPVTFSPVNAATTTVTFTTAGTYTLRLTASDGALSASDDVIVTVNPDVNLAPVVNAGPDQSITLPATATLSGTVTDDGKPAGNTVTIAWSFLSGPAAVTFNPPGTASTTATFTVAGTYTLRLSASDGALSAFDDVVVTVIPANTKPVANAGPDQTVQLPSFGTLTGSATDDGLPPGSHLTFTWSKVSGPGTVTFANASAATTQVAFSAVGVYTLRLTVSDSQLSSTDDVVVTVLPPPPPPSVAIAAPADGADVTAPVNVVGSVSGGDWKLEVSLNGADGAATQAWTTIASGSGAVSNGTLGLLDPSLLLNGIYTLRLSATDAASQTTRTAVTVNVIGNLKLGNFALTFVDVKVPMTGLPIEIDRTYDTRDKRSGDFGFGWSLGIRNLRLEKSRRLGDSWQMTSSGGSFPNYCVQPTRSHFVTITFPNGRVYKFQAAVSPSCQQLVPLEFTSVVYQQVASMPGTQGASLIAIGADDDVEIVGSIPGDVQLIDLNTVDLYNPTLYRLTTAEGYQYTIDQSFGATEVVDPNGNTLTISRGGVLHSSGKSVVFTRDGAGRITAVTDPQGHSLIYTYDGNGDLASVTDREGNVTRFEYGGAHYLQNIVDPRGIQAIRNDYDANGRLLSTTDANGNQILYTHDLASHHETITDRNGNSTLYEYDDRGNVARTTDPLGGVIISTYDANDNLLTRIDPLGRQTTYTYDASGNRLTDSDPLGNTTRYTYNSRNQVLTVIDPLGRITTNRYDANGDLLSTQDPLGHTSANTYTPAGLPLTLTDAQNHVTTFQYDGAGNLTQQKDALGNVSTYTYDANGNRLSQVVTRTVNGSPETLTTTYEYDKQNRPIKTTNPDGTFTRVVYDPNGKQLETYDALGRKTAYAYDEAERLTRTTYPDATFEESTYDNEGHRLTAKDRAGRLTGYTYDKLGRLTVATAPDLSTTRTVYDAAGQVRESYDALDHKTSYEYDTAGRRTEVTNALLQTTTFGYDKNGNQTSLTDALGHTTLFVYDELGRRTKTVFPDGSFAEVDYDELGRQVAKTDPAGKATQYGYDALGRLVSVTDALGQVTRYGYDELGSRISQTDANGHATTFEYDRLGHRTKRTLPLNQVETYSYDPAGNLTTRMDFNGHKTTYSYDALSRLLAKTPDPFYRAAPVTFTYNALGLRATMTDPSGTTTYTYDERNRLLTKQTPEGTLSYSYDVAGNLRSVSSSHTNGVSVAYTYDELNRLSRATDATGSTTYGYDSVGNLQSYAYPNGVAHTYTYDDLNRLTQLTVAKGSSALASYTYTLGAAGNRLAVTELGGRSVTYTYDDLYRLTFESISGSATQNGAIGYTYDPVGNRKSLTSTVPAISSGTLLYDANDRLTSDQYDDNGNTVSSGSISNIYDFENHLVQHGNDITIVYDGDGNRVAKTVGGVTTSYLVDTNSLTGYAQVLEELQGGAVVRKYTYGLDLISETQATGTSFYGHDGHGSVRFLTDASGTITDRYDFDAFGNLIERTGSTPNLYLFAGEQLDPNLGLYYNRARYYDEQRGRFWTADTFEGDPQAPASLHKYLYASADPASRIDPSGNESLADVAVSFAIDQTLQALPISAVLRAGEFAYRVAKGQDIGEAAKGAALGLLEDAALTFVSAGLLRFAAGILPLRAAGSTFARAANSLWNKVDILERGKAVENFIFENVLGRSRTLHFNFPVIDDFFQGVATSIKSLDLTAATYQSDSAIFSQLSSAADALANFTTKKFAGAVVNSANITERVLIVAFEDGAATVQQELVLKQFLQHYKSIWPNIKVVFQFIP